jgi:hypothetical protein
MLQCSPPLEVHVWDRAYSADVSLTSVESEDGSKPQNVSRAFFTSPYRQTDVLLREQLIESQHSTSAVQYSLMGISEIRYGSYKVFHYMVFYGHYLRVAFIRLSGFLGYTAMRNF